ncbi:MAG: GtrA family protein [Proteobacteria bacterium]|nr:GtrA family protein [Pseudomonadota bacterium]
MKIFHQLGRFIATGVINTVLGYLVYAFGIVVLGWTYFWSVVLSYAIGVTFSYFMFRTFVFTSGDRGWRSYARFIPTYIALFWVNVGCMFVLVDILGWNKLVAQAAVLVFCAALSFVINRTFVFKQRVGK